MGKPKGRFLSQETSGTIHSEREAVLVADTRDNTARKLQLTLLHVKTKIPNRGTSTEELTSSLEAVRVINNMESPRELLRSESQKETQS